MSCHYFSLLFYYTEVKPGENILNFVDGVIDSSRYFVIRIKDPNSSRTTWLGVGFRERDQAFDFKNCLNEYVKFINRMHLANQLSSSSGVSESYYEQNNTSSLYSDEANTTEGANGEYILSSSNSDGSKVITTRNVLIHTSLIRINCI